MDTGMEVFIFLTYAAGLLIIFLLAKFFAFSGKIFVKIICNSVLGGIILLTINIVGGQVGIHIPFNMITSLIAGTLGVPGVALLWIIS